jgi:hypothetical protein
MSVAQALAIAAAAWVTAIASDQSMSGVFHAAQWRAELLAGRLETTAAIHLEHIEGGFCATPDGVRIERKAALR